jgi:leader peptidase (prepilin peptidase)/N-methyltransferase
LEVVLDALVYITIGLFGLLFGSFGNVVIWRLPRGESLSHPGSHCPVCDKPIAWYDNVPVLSWLLLGGKCRACGTRISARYPTVELLSGALWVLAAVRFGFTAQTAFAIAFFYVLLLLAFIDLDTTRLPNSLVGLLAVVALAGMIASQLTGTPLVPLLTPQGGWLASPIAYGLVGAVATGGSILLIALVYARVRGVQGFGMGDIKLLGVLGLFLGLYGLLALGVGSLLGAVYGVAAGRKTAEGLQHKYPFGPFLAVSGVIVALFGEQMVAWYLRVVAGGM